MKTFKDSFLRRPLASQQSGQALVIVLGFVMLMTVLILVFFSSVLTERASTKAAASGNSARQLAQSAVQLVEGTITQATVPNIADSTATAIAWASQPGMIRTYGGGTANSYTASSAPLAYYKLYSSLNPMIVTASTTPSITNFKVDSDVSGTWDQNPALYTDLNAPIPNPAADPKNPFVYPIADPRASSSYAAGVAVDGFSYTSTCPISGVSVDGVQQVNSGNVTSSSNPPLLPMPVAWIYVLKDGTLTTPTSGAVGPPITATFPTTGAAAPSAANPIVGRFGYWTDDDCSKVNLNTASEGTYWDPPIANTGYSTSQFTNTTTVPQTPAGDAQLVGIQPAQYEYQRYPGHPATTCLSEVFGNAINAGSRQALVQTVDNATPRLNDTSPPDSSTIPATTGVASSMGGTVNASGAVPPKFDRLYSTVDDFNFTPTRTLQTLGASTTQQVIEQTRFFLTTSSKGSDLNLFGLPRVTIWPVWDTTGVANGTYPGVNNAAKRSLTDNEMIHCSTVSNSNVSNASTYSYESGSGSEHLMEFTRDTALSPTIDYNLTRNQQLLKYLQNLMATGVPGFGGNFAAKYPVPNVTPSTTTKNSDQILTEIFDYIRCTNLADQSMAANFTSGSVVSSSYTPSSTVTTGKANTANIPVGEVVPTQGPGTARGFGRFPIIRELALVATKISDCIDPTKTEGTTGTFTLPTPQYLPAGSTTTQLNQVKTITVSNGGPITTVDPTKQTLVEWAVIPQYFSPMCGYTGMGNNIRIQFIINGLSFGSSATPSTISANPTSGTYSYPILSTAASTTPFTADLFDGAYPYSTGGITYPLPGLLTAGHVGSGGRDSVIGGEIGPLEFNTLNGSAWPDGLVLVPGTNAKCGSVGGGTMKLSATSITVNIYSPADTGAKAANLVQSLNFTFPATDVPIPLWRSPNSFTDGVFRAPGNNPTITWSGPVATPTAAASFSYGTDVSARGSGHRWGSSLYYPFDTTTDMVRTLVSNLAPTGASSGTANATLNGIPIDGDVRLLAISSSVPAAAFMPSLKIDGSLALSTDYAVHGMRSGSGNGLKPDNSWAQGTTTYITGHGTSPNYTSRPMSVLEPVVPAGITQVVIDGTGTTPGDWDNGPGLLPDGPLCNKADEGAAYNTGSNLPYIGNDTVFDAAAAMQTTFFSPSRQVSSPVMFGSLLVGPDHPWRTLLFRPPNLPGYQVNAGYTHPGNDMKGAANATAVPDHLLLDLFRMPVVEPYAISEPLATAGQVNLNTQIAPFTYITRTTGLRAVLKSVMITGVPNDPALIPHYKQYYPYSGSIGSSDNHAWQTRYPIDLDNTVAMLNPSTPDTNSTGQTPFPEFTRSSHSYAAGSNPAPNFFVSASQICDLPLIPLLTSATTPTGPISTISGGSVSLTSLASFWKYNQLTGDNSLERPYSLIYPRVTTRSNTFTVHVRAQSLQKIPNSTQNVWTEPVAGTSGTDQITGEYRGAFTIEKYYDPTNAAILAPSNSTTSALTDSQDATIPTDARMVSSITTTGTTTTVQPVLWRLLENRRFGQ